MAEDSLNFKVLYHTNEKILSLDELTLAINDNPKCRKHSGEEILNVINALSEKGLIYRSPDYTEILSVIDLSAF
jgi:hypothetical protein